jgi:ribosome-binding factor A
MTTRRQQRVSDLLREELGILITAELIDPRLADAMVTVTHVEVSQDLHNARVYVEQGLSPTDSAGILDALRHSETYLRKAIAENLNLRVVPHFSFHLDDTGARAQRIDALLDGLTNPAGNHESHESDLTQ